MSIWKFESATSPPVFPPFAGCPDPRPPLPPSLSIGIVVRVIYNHPLLVHTERGRAPGWMSDATADVAPHLPRPTTLASSAAAALLLGPSSAAAAYSAVRLLLPVKTLPWGAFSFSLTSPFTFHSPLLCFRRDTREEGEGCHLREKMTSNLARLEAKQAGQALADWPTQLIC